MNTKKKIIVAVSIVIGLAVTLLGLHLIVNGLNIQTIFRAMHGVS